MVKIHSLFKAACICAAMAALTDAYASGKDREISTCASDSRISYSGRTLHSGDNVSFDWSGTSVRVRFTGRSISIRCSDTKANYFNVWIDSEYSEKADKIIRTAGQDTTIVIAENLKKGEHEIILQKRTEGEQGTVTIHEFITDGDILQAESGKQRHMEFIGDSYTCGFGTENSIATDPFKPETENCNLTYAAIAARYFNADFTLLSHSGQGIARNYDDFKPGYTMVERYDQTFDENKDIRWSSEDGCTTPDIVVIYLGANDFSTEKQPSKSLFCTRYKELLAKVRSNYGEETPILCFAAKLDDGIFEYVKAACLKSGIKNVSFATMQDTAFNWDSDLGACYHPNYSGHRKMASIIIPYIATVTGWEMEAKAYK